MVFDGGAHLDVGQAVSHQSSAELGKIHGAACARVLFVDGLNDHVTLLCPTKKSSLRCICLPRRGLLVLLVSSHTLRFAVGHVVFFLLKHVWCPEQHTKLFFCSFVWCALLVRFRADVFFRTWGQFGQAALRWSVLTREHSKGITCLVDAECVFPFFVRFHIFHFSSKFCQIGKKGRPSDLVGW